MTMGKTSTAVLTDIANAIRFQAGVSTLYKPSEMAAAITALDGTNAGRYQAQGYPQLEGGVLSDAIYTDIADAIRGQNGSNTTYAPDDMADAILALTWDNTLKARALLLSDGTLEFNYLAGRRSTLGGTIVATYDPPTTALSAASGQPWYAQRASITKVVFDSSFASAGFTNCAYWFSGLANLVEVSGFENMTGIATATQMFASCSSLESIYATSFTNTISSGSMMFYSCPHLVGGTDGFVPSNTSNATVCKVGTGGVLTNPSSDIREWCKVFVYSDGAVVFTATGSVDANKTLLASGRLCVSAKYNASGIIPGYANRAQMRSVSFAADMANYSYVNMNYWFYGLGAITTFTGIANLDSVHEMQYTFSSCTGVTSLDFRGFDPSHLTSLYLTFGSCSNLVTIYADSSWTLPLSGLSGSQTFYNCTSLVGGNGTAYSSSKISYTYMRIDATGTPGYLTSQ